jgi:hypothetical protein
MLTTIFTLAESTKFHKKLYFERWVLVDRVKYYLKEPTQSS